MRRATAWWRQFWFESGSAHNLAAARIVFATQGLWVVLSRDFAAVSGLPIEFWSQVQPSWQWRYLLFHGHGNLELALQWCAVGALVAALVGVYPRIACFVAGLLLYHLAPLEAIVWTPAPVVRGLTITVPGLMILAFSRCGDALVVQRRGAAVTEPVPGLDYSWQVRLIQLLLCQVYLFSAYAKLERTGFEWISADNLRHWFLYLNQVPELGWFRTPGLLIAAHPTLDLVIALTAIGFEATFILVLFSRRARRLLVTAAFFFHVGIFVTMNITFPAMPLLLVFVDWDWVWRRLKLGRRDVVSAPTAGVGHSSS